MTCQMLCNGSEQKSPEGRPGLSLASSRCTSLHYIRYGIVFMHTIQDTIMASERDQLLLRGQEETKGAEKETRTIHQNPKTGYKKVKNKAFC